MDGVNTWNATSQALMQGGNLFQQMLERRIKARQDQAAADAQAAKDEQSQQNWLAEYALKVAEAKRKAREDETKANELVKPVGRAYDPADPKSIADWNDRMRLDAAASEISVYDDPKNGGLTSSDVTGILTDKNVLGTAEGARINSAYYRPEHDAALMRQRDKLQSERIRASADALSKRISSVKDSKSANLETLLKMQAEAKAQYDSLSVLKDGSYDMGLNKKLADDVAIASSNLRTINTLVNNARKFLDGSGANQPESVVTPKPKKIVPPQVSPGGGVGSLKIAPPKKK